ncbi:MAG: ABC transporter ATP-binding protein [Acidobacteria bacterium]|nr:ABC transporter ATP-binding protein [Acidobacteriota bacterium]MBS1867303.1 ABC transporter ATP-binding protein [Acidobacteriota bacterium]
MSLAIQTASLTKRYRSVRALDSLDLSVEPGGVHALVGPNGAGKTTLIKILMNILRATSGKASVAGVDSTRISGKAFQTIGYVSENQKLPGWMRCGYFLKYLRPFYPTWDTALESQLIQQFDLPVDRKLRHLSRGMQMKAALASALAFRPRLIILDEPFSGLDPMVRDELGQALVDRAADSTIFLSSHDLGEIEGFATRLTYLDKGRHHLTEDVASLRARFREVELTFDAPVRLPPDLPPTWLQTSASEYTLKFIDSAFDQESLQAEVVRRFGSLQHATFSPMTIRDIFLGLAKSNRRSS